MKRQRVGTRGIWRDLAFYVPIVLPTYGLAGAVVDTVTGTREGGRGFWETAALWAVVGWWVPIVFLPAALVVLGLASRLPLRWHSARRRMVLLLSAPALFALVLGMTSLAVGGSMNVLTSPHVAVVVAPALAYAASLSLPRNPDAGGGAHA